MPVTSTAAAVTGAIRMRASSDGRRPLVVGGALAGLAAAVSVLVVCMAVALAGWFAADDGGHGTTTDALRIGADVWLVAHRSGIVLGGTLVTLVPLGLTVLCAHVCYRMGRWAGLTSEPGEQATVVVAALAMATTYAVVALGVALLAAGGSARTDAAFCGAFVIAFLCGGLGLGVGSGLSLPARVPVALRAAALGGAVAFLSLTAASAAVLAYRLATHLSEGANVLSGLRLSTSGDAFTTLAAVGLLPNAVACTAAYLLGPGFALGTGTAVAPGAVALGPLPASPLLAALPSHGLGSWTAVLLLGVPVLAGVVAGWRATGAFPCSGRPTPASRRAALLGGAGRGLSAGALGALLVGVAMWLSGGALGSGRLSELGPPVLDVTLRAVVTLGLGGALGGFLRELFRTRPWRSRPAAGEPIADDESTVSLN